MRMILYVFAIFEFHTSSGTHSDRSPLSAHGLPNVPGQQFGHFRIDGLRQQLSFPLFHQRFQGISGWCFQIDNVTPDSLRCISLD